MEKGTRWRILEEVHRRGRASVAELARGTGVNPATVHHHLARLEREGLILTEALRQGPGRPRLVCVLSEQGRVLFPQGYRWLTEEILETLRAVEGEGRLDRFLRRMGDRIAARYRSRLADLVGQKRLAEVAAILGEMGFEPFLQQTRRGITLCNRNCPVWGVAQRYPQLCLMEHRLVDALLAAHTRRTEYRLGGAPVCTYLAADSTV